MKIVLDTNVLIAGSLNPRGTPADIINLIQNEEITFCFDGRITGEYRSVFNGTNLCWTMGTLILL